jgi:translocation and assembly module TamB
VAGGTAILAVSGTVGTPRVELRGEPEMPQDEVLSRLLFGVAGGRLSPWQATRLGLAAASLAGTRGSDAGPLARVRSGLGLNRLGLVADERGEAAIEGGRDLGDRAYLGARQSSRTGEPQGVLRFEASPRIQLEADVGPVGGTRAGVAFEHEF